MTLPQFQEILSEALQEDLRHCTKTYSSKLPFLNIAYKHDRHTINLETDYQEAKQILNQLRSR